MGLGLVLKGKETFKTFWIIIYQEDEPLLRTAIARFVNGVCVNQCPEN